MSGCCISCGERQTLNEEATGLQCPQCVDLHKHLSIGRSSVLRSGEVRLYTAGNIDAHDLIFDTEAVTSCGGIGQGIPCRLASSSYGFVVDPTHLQDILDKWRKTQSRYSHG